MSCQTTLYFTTLSQNNIIFPLRWLCSKLHSSVASLLQTIYVNIKCGLAHKSNLATFF
jgi:hypothetical protein